MFYLALIFIFITIVSLFAIWWLVLITPKSELPSKTSRIHRYKNLDIHYQKSGSGKNLVLLHGIGASTYIWRYIIPILEKTFTVIAIDIVGFGYSSKYANYDHGLDSQTTTIHGFLQDINVNEAYLVGSSMGGAIALWMAHMYPSHYTKVAGLSPAVNPKHTKNIRLKYISLLGKGFRYFLNPPLMRQILRFVFSKKELYANEHILAYLRPYQDDGTSILCFINAFDSILKDPRLPDELSSLNSEVLLLWGKKDLLTPLRYGEDLTKILPRSTLEVHESAGHHMMEEEPDWTAKKLAEFFRHS